MRETTESYINSAVAGHDWERRSPRRDDVHVSGHTFNWLNAMPKGFRPVHLQLEFPRIVNELGRLWADTPALDRYFDELEFSPRHDRRGFPPLIKEELLTMHVYSLRTRSVAYEQRARLRRLRPAGIPVVQDR